MIIKEENRDYILFYSWLEVLLTMFCCLHAKDQRGEESYQRLLLKPADSLFSKSLPGIKS